jgi:hypothetical protein
MSHIKLFEQFLLEQTTNVNILRDMSDLLAGMCKDAKTNKRIKYITTCNKAMSNYDAPGWSKDGNTLRKLLSFPKIKEIIYAIEYEKRRAEIHSSQLIMLNNNELIEMVHTTNIKSFERFNFPSLSEDRIMFISDTPLNKELIEQIIPDEIKGTQKNDIYTCKKVLVEDNSNQLKTFTSNQYYTGQGSGKGPSIKVYSMIYRFDVAKSSGESVTFEQAKELPELKTLLDKYPVEIISTEKQIKNGTFVFGIDKKHLIGSGEMEKITVSDDCKWLHDSFGITNTGYIRKLPTYEAYWSDRAAKIGTFDASNIEGWKKALEIIDKQLEKYIKELTKRGYKVWCTPEEKHQYRGYIMKRRFGV